jgi:hypothetical protein
MKFLCDNNGLSSSKTDMCLVADDQANKQHGLLNSGTAKITVLRELIIELKCISTQRTMIKVNPYNKVESLSKL